MFNGCSLEHSPKEIPKINPNPVVGVKNLRNPLHKIIPTQKIPFLGKEAIAPRQSTLIAIALQGTPPSASELLPVGQTYVPRSRLYQNNAPTMGRIE